MINLTPTQKLIYEVIKNNPGIDSSRLRIETGIGRRTLYSVKMRLIKEQLIKEYPCLQDIRKHKYIVI